MTENNSDQFNQIPSSQQNLPSSQQGFDNSGSPPTTYGDLRYAPDKPASVTVFGVLNCIFGGLGLICTPLALLGVFFSDKFPQMEMTNFDKTYSFISSIVGIGFAIWEILVGIALLRFLPGARRSAVIYAACAVILVVLSMGVNIYSLSTGQITPPESTRPGAEVGFYIGQSCGMFIPLIYPVLLLIFMKTAKVKEAFRLIGE